MGAANEAELGLSIGVLPNDGVLTLDTLQFGIVDDVDLCAFRHQRCAQFLGFGGQILDMVQTHGTVGGGCCTEVLQVGTVFVVQLSSQPLFHAGDIRNVLHDLHADGRAQKLGFGLALAIHLDDPCSLTALIGKQAEVRHETSDRAHDVHDAGIAVAPGAQDGVGVNHRGGLCPA